MTCEPPISPGPMPCHAWPPRTQIAPGVRGFTYRQGEDIVIPFIVAEKEGAGDVGRFLDSLSPRCVIVSVTSSRLRGMLVRRGFRKHIVGDNDEWRRV